MSKPSETLVVVNSANRDIQIFPESNDFTLDLKQRYEVQLVSLGFLELPYSQFLVEREWAGFFADVGLSFPPQASRTLAFRTPCGGSRALACLPAPYTAVVFEGLQGAAAVWRVDAGVGPLRAHGLANNSLGVVPACVVFDPLLPPLQVAAVPREDVVVTAGAPVPTPAAGYRAVLACTAAGPRTFLSPEHLAAALNAFFSDPTIDLPLRFRYDAAETALLLQPQGCSEDVILLDLAEPNLLNTLYFPCASGVQRLQPLKSTRFPGSVRREFPVGNYDFGSLRQQLEVLLNPLGQFGSVPAGTVYVAFFDESPLPPFHAVALTAAVLYDPKAVALTLSQQFAAAALPHDVRFDFQDDTFVAFGPAAFRIFWADSRLGGQLGFDGDLRLDVFHRGSRRFYVAQPNRVQLPAMFANESTQHMRTLVLQAYGRLQASLPVAVSGSGCAGAALHIPAGLVPSEYLVAVAVSDGFVWAVAAGTQAGLMPAPPAPLPAWTTELMPLVAQPPLPAGCPCAGQAVPAFGGAANLYFPTPPGSMQPRLAEILGFAPGANLWPWQAALDACGPSTALVAPFHVTLEGPPYVLLDFGLPHMSASIVHRNGQDLRSTFFGAVALFSNFKLERYYKVEQATTGINVINSLHVRIYNPWGALYVFHGKNWSAALNLVHVTKPVRTECA